VLDILMKSMKSLSSLATMFLLSGFRPFTTMKNYDQFRTIYPKWFSGLYAMMNTFYHISTRYVTLIALKHTGSQRGIEVEKVVW